MDKPRVFFYATSQDGTAWYRMVLPFKELRKQGFTVGMNPCNPLKPVKDNWTNLDHDENGTPKCTHQLAAALGEFDKPNFDVVVFQRMDTGGMFSLAQAI